MTTTVATIKTVFTHETKNGTWHIDHNDDAAVQEPYSVSKDEDHICSCKTLDEAMDLVDVMCCDFIEN